VLGKIVFKPRIYRNESFCRRYLPSTAHPAAHPQRYPIPKIRCFTKTKRQASSKPIEVPDHMCNLLVTGKTSLSNFLNKPHFLLQAPRRRLVAPILSVATNGQASTGSPTTSTSQQQPSTTTATAPPTSSKVTHYPGLRGDDFRHPLDQQNTQVLRLLPGMEFIARSVMSPATEQILYLENISSSIKAGPDQLPSLHKSLVHAATVLGMEVPDLYVRQNPVPNAYTLAISGKQPFIVVHTALLDLLTPEEIQAALAHELGHLKCEHGVWLTAANVLALGTVSLLPWVNRAVEEALTRWLRAAELTCDRAALLVAQDPRVVASALMKLAGGSAQLAKELNVEAFLRQARSYDEATSTSLGWFLRNAQNRALSHPLPVLRAREVDRWSTSPEFLALLSGGVKESGVRTVGAAGAAAVN
jgi:Zn-dependent protease with chaperone function